MKVLARTGHPDFLDLPWELALEDWRSERIVEVTRGISRHVVRFVAYEDAIYALKEMPEGLARREYGLLRGLERRDMPVVTPVGVVAERADDLGAVLITRHLDYSLPFRTLFAREAPREDLRDRLLGAAVDLLVRLHLAGFFWGDFSLSNTLFRRDAGLFAAYLVDAETSEMHPTLSDGQRRHDVEIAEENIVGELEDVAEEVGRPLREDAAEIAAEIVRRYETLWAEIAHDEVFNRSETHRIGERLRRINDLGFDVEEIELERVDDSYRMHIDLSLVEPGHHRRRLADLTGLRAQENQARRLLEDFRAFRDEHGLPEKIAAARWLAEAFEPAVAAVPPELRGKREAAEVYHEILEHRWYLSQQAGRDLGLMPAVEAYVRDVLRHAADERTLLVEDLG